MKQLVIWSEDDATLGMNDHEYLEAALKRIFGVSTASRMLEMAKTTDGGDEVRYELKLTITHGHPDSSITVEPMP